MKITGVRVHVLKTRPNSPETEGLVRIFTDEGIEGNSIVSSASAEELVRRANAEAWLTGSEFEKPIGSDPFYREKLSKSLGSQYFWHPLSNEVLCALDEALWDIAGKALKIPIYKLLGAYRDRIPAYASTPLYEKESDYTEILAECLAKGYKAIKIHPLRNWKKDIALCKSVRDAVGDEMILMLDPFVAYSRDEALKVGREIQKLNFYWYEDPLPTSDIESLQDLCASLDIPILMGEQLTNLSQYDEYIRRHATDAVRCMDIKVGGISGMMKVAHLAESFGMKCEPHSWGSDITQAAHLHVMLAISNCDFFELPVPEGVFDRAVRNGIRIDENGYVHAPRGNGLGVEIDWEEVDKITTKITR
jgi:L-alanine-DL-glutamate epimerase-like enolase superfamily enzyme